MNRLLILFFVTERLAEYRRGLNGETYSGDVGSTGRRSVKWWTREGN
ncbi:hypothetical protein M139_3591 [Bacteroides fragilis str. S23L24]|uniref:Uncharacterized protein n=1 Tax=Bacteroides fragilis str. 3783N1-6 TaxID=1339310 RepID=A0AB73AH18_BACFG|nr:hypothetical protein M112_3508 [Bacteroides fragilis str. 3986 T(B)13]EYA65164.1 hypothetical protein M139_3591 [Bacteroides fragilis str. S23L24]EYB08361.1 hypothetical protein M119_3591 [Bacteroides fragilis str. 3783N1-6]